MADKRVLVVDDEIHIVHVVAIKLRNNGYEVITADNGAEAFDLAREEKPDMIVTDYQMPVMSGLELCKALQADPQTVGIPIIMLTARGFDLSDSERGSAGISVLMSKPFSPAEVLKRALELSAAGSVSQES